MPTPPSPEPSNGAKSLKRELRLSRADVIRITVAIASKKEEYQKKALEKEGLVTLGLEFGAHPDSILEGVGITVPKRKRREEVTPVEEIAELKAQITNLQKAILFLAKEWNTDFPDVRADYEKENGPSPQILLKKE